ncbi:hypothetical protein DL98DRAFT_614731 [Cadophora sp. DSE1049]|nr:hypothetical protein DL98DRAFT_614731 [Cadophora sp. DSE1049]
MNDPAGDVALNFGNPDDNVRNILPIAELRSMTLSCCLELLKKPWENGNRTPSSDDESISYDKSTWIGKFFQEWPLDWLERYGAKFVDPDELTHVSELMTSLDFLAEQHLIAGEIANILEVHGDYYFVEERSRHLTGYYSVYLGYPTLLEIPDERGAGYATAYDGILGLERLPSVEMANARQRRRRNDERHRLAVQQARTGVEDIDLLDPNPFGVPPPFMPRLQTINPEPLPPPDLDPIPRANGDNMVLNDGAQQVDDQVNVQLPHGDPPLQLGLDAPSFPAPEDPGYMQALEELWGLLGIGIPIILLRDNANNIRDDDVNMNDDPWFPQFGNLQTVQQLPGNGGDVDPDGPFAGEHGYFNLPQDPDEV